MGVYRYSEKHYDARGCEPWDEGRGNHVLNLRRISKNEYFSYLPLFDRKRNQVRQIVRNFVYKDQYFSHVTTIEPTELKLEYVEVTTSKDHDKVIFPPWVSIDCDVTHDQRFTSFRMSK